VIKLYFYQQITPKIYEIALNFNGYIYCGCKGIVNPLKIIMGILFQIVIGK